MKDYSAMSDFEINKAVAISIGGFYEEDMFEPEQTIFRRFIRPDRKTYAEFNPCNNPADAWPILMANHIGIMPFKSGAATAWPTSIGLLSNFHVKHENPLRAAMICYLMMKDAEKCYG